MNRRFLLLTLFTLPISVAAQSTAAARIAILTDLVNAIAAAGKAISALTAGVKDVVVASSSAYDYIAAKRELNRLNDIVRCTGNLIASQNSLVVKSLDDYLEKKQPTEADWETIAGNIGKTLTTVYELSSDIEQENGSFVNQDASLALKEAFAARVSILNRLSTMRPPFSSQERVALRQISKEYKVLITNARAAIKQLNIFIATKK
jgi:hypothetical protein